MQKNLLKIKKQKQKNLQTQAFLKNIIIIINSRFLL